MSELSLFQHAGLANGAGTLSQYPWPMFQAVQGN
jgi:hypothetical protein